jgi:4-amino-4-deoxy-L-arabinose transferase-like glycosyltransferase
MVRLALLAILALAAVLRLLWLGRMSLWMDEGFTLLIASAAWDRLASTAVTLDWHPIGSYIIAKLGLLTVPSTEWGLRLPSAIFGTLTVAAMYPLARQIGGRDSSPRKALSVTGLGAVMAMLVLANRDARSYSLAVFGITLATLAWSLALDNQGKTRQRAWMAWLVAGLVAIYCHYYALVVLGWQWLVAALSQPKERCWWLTLPLVALGYAPALPRLLLQASLEPRGHPDPDWHALVDVFYAQTVGFTLNFPGIWTWYLLSLCGLLGALAGAMSEGPIRRVGMVYWGFLATIIGVPLLTSGGAFETKYFVLTSPLFILLVSEAIFRLPWHSVQNTALAALLLLNLTSALNAIGLSEWHRQDFRGAAQVLAHNYRAGDRILLEPDWLEPVMRHYLGQEGLKPPLGVVPIAPEESLNFRAAGLDPACRIWVVRAALAAGGSRVLPELSGSRVPLLSWKSSRRAPLFEVELYLFSSASGLVNDRR